MKYFLGILFTAICLFYMDTAGAYSPGYIIGLYGEMDNIFGLSDWTTKGQSVSGAPVGLFYGMRLDLAKEVTNNIGLYLGLSLGESKGQIGESGVSYSGTLRSVGIFAFKRFGSQNIGIDFGFKDEANYIQIYDPSNSEIIANFEWAFFDIYYVFLKNIEFSVRGTTSVSFKKRDYNMNYYNAGFNFTF